MTAKITVTLGGASDADDLEYTDSTPFFKPGEAGVGRWSFESTFANGDDGLGEFIVDNDDGSIPKSDGTRNLAAKNPVTLTEDASGTEYTLVYGRIVEKEVTRNEDYPIGDASQYRVTVQAPGDLALMKLTEDWVRSDAESDYDRLVALQALILNGASSTVDRPWNTVDITVASDHLAPNTNTVTMPAHTYQAGTSVDDIIIDCATTAGKVWGIVPHHVDGTGTHKCLQYILENDNTTNASTVSISDDPDEIDPVADPPVIAPQWGSPRHEAGQEQVFGLVVRYGTGDNFVYVEGPHITTDVAAYDHAVDVFYDDESETAAQARARGLAMLDYRRSEHVTHTVILKVRADHAHLIAPGMSIGIKSAAAMSGSYLGTEQTRRIASVQYEPLAPEVGEVDAFYQITIELDRRLSRAPISKGTKPGPKPPSGSCTDLTSTLAPTGFDGESSTFESWYAGGVDTNPQNTGDGPHSGTGFIFWHSASNPWAGYHFSGTWTAGKTYTVGFWSKLDAAAAPCVYTLGAVTGIRTFGTDKATLTVSDAETEWTYHEIEWTPATTVTGDGNREHDGVALDMAFTGSTNDGVFFDDGTVQECTDPEPPISIGGPGEGEVGTGAGNSIPPGTVVEHGDLSGKGGTMHDASQIEFTPTGTIAADDVQTAVAEVATDAAALVTAHTGDSSDAHNASAISVLDTAANFTGTDVEAVLAELQDNIDGVVAGSVSAEDVSITDSGGYFTGTDVEAALQELGAGGGGSSSGPWPLGMPYGTLERSYTFDSTVESWTTTGGTLSSTSSRLRLLSSTLQFALEPSGVDAIADGEVQMEARLVAGVDCDVAFRVTDANNLYVIEFIEQANGSKGVRLYKRVSSTFTNLGITWPNPFIENDGAPHMILVRFVGSAITCYLDNTLVGAWTDTTYTTGRVGIAGGSTAGNTIDADNVRVYSITTETQGSPGTGDRV